MRLINTNLLNYFYKNGVKPLKDSLAKKFDASKLVNNLLTTASGFALDARQGPVIQRELDEINSNLSVVTVSKNVSVTLSSQPIYVSNDFNTNDAAQNLIQPMPSGVLVSQDAICIVVAHFVIAASKTDERISYGIRNFKSSSDYSDSADVVSSAGVHSDKYTYMRMGRYTAGTYLRPIVSAADGGTCSSCALSVVSLKA